MKTSKEWWDEVKTDPDKITDWLLKQYRGEVTAAHRIRRFSDEYAPDAFEQSILEKIAGQEEQHATWIAILLEDRNISLEGIDHSIASAERRYWKETLPGIDSFETGSAVAAHAEKMRLERIRVIVDDRESPIDIRYAFSKILKDEVWHEAAFRGLAGTPAMEEMQDRHELGMEALGLTA